MPTRDARPTVLLADDHRHVLEAVSGLLDTDFELVAAVADGQRALESTRRLDPDVVVLDITMPGLNGFQVAAELKRTGSRARIVFLSMHSADDYVATAITSGADGYVLKTRIQPDLIRALHHVLAGRLYMPTLAALSAAAAGGCGHAVHFYEDHSSYLDEAARFLGATLRRGEPVLMIVTEAATRDGIRARFAADGLDLAGGPGRGWCQIAESGAVFSQCMPNGWPDADRVGAFIATLERSRLATASGASRLTVFVDHSLKAHRSEVAVTFEHLWAALTSTLPLFTVCAYPVESSSGNGLPDLCAGLCVAHRMVSYAPMAFQR